MGQEINDSGFSDDDRKTFEARLREETRLLKSWFEENRFAFPARRAGFELEAWLIDGDAMPVPAIEPFLEALDNPLAVPELAKFNLELNCAPATLAGDALSRLEADLAALWRDAQAAAHAVGAETAMIGILPTVRPEHLTLENMSPRNRYHALNEQILKARRGQPIKLKIDGVENLKSVHDDVMTEAATTSFQIHLQVKADEGARYFKRSQDRVGADGRRQRQFAVSVRA